MTSRLLLFCLLLFPAPAEAAAHLRPSPKPAERWGETFTFVADLDDDTYVLVQLAVTNLGPGSETGLCRLLIAAPGRAPISADQRVARGDWSWSGGPQESLRIGGCGASDSAAGAVVSAALGGSRVELRLPPLTAVSPPGARIAAGDATYQSRLLLLGARTEAVLQLPGETVARTLGGGAYADQSRSDMAPSALARTWVRFRALRASPPLLLLGRQTPGGAIDPAWWRTGGDFHALKAYALERSGDAANPAYAVPLDGGAAGTIRSRGLLYRHAPVESLGLVGRALAPIVGSPVTFTYRAVLQRQGQPDLAGILEVSLSSE